MGLTIRLQDEDSKKIEEVYDIENLLHDLLPEEDDSSFQCLRFINFYGNTTFNVLQISTFLVELERISQKAITTEEITLLSKIKDLAEKVTHHKYLKFIGD